MAKRRGQASFLFWAVTWRVRVVHVHGDSRDGVWQYERYRVPLRAIIVHALNSLKLQDFLSQTAEAFAGEMLEMPGMRGF